MDSCSNQQKKHGIMVEGQGGDDLDSVSSSLDVSSSLISSTHSDFLDDATTTTESSSASCSSSSPNQLSSKGPFYEMNSLMQQLPLKRGLSKYFQGKSQSFTSLSNVRSLEDLAKPENPYNKKLKYCKSDEGSSESQKTCTPKTSSKIITKKSSTNLRMNISFLGNRRPRLPPPKSNSF
ncbi:uncharacterized protein LOC122064951 isoform X2 [Macadamia integrifolia]|uniref:uncharacterized protein LOC122064951 isoform X1 n=1 Tax=Macadamia integrifolia TaxID=60698 RepID=UPI001C4FF8F7|nr:uncharacterized protein LOC122064951 isoform X1 [Macadamia integrifolia]XP_042484667.1 uncharacterized protein LOC122064951 isoform X2 [Macadamia integrifolia]